MDIKILTQPKLSNGDSYTLGKHLKDLLISKKPKFLEATLFFGLVKNNAFEEIFEYIKTFILNGGDLNFYLSQSQKGTMKKIINSLLELGVNVYFFKNENKDFISDFQYKGAIFKSAKKSVILLSSGNFSQNGLFEGYNTVTEFSYDLSTDKPLFDTAKNSIFSEHVISSFVKITRDNFNEFFSDEIPTIEEFTHKDIEQKEPIITSIDDINIDIEIDDNVDFLETPIELEKPKKEVKPIVLQEKKALSVPIDAIEFEETKYFMEDDALDIENMLFTSSSNKELSNNFEYKTIDNKTIIEENKKESNIEETKIIAKTTNLSKTSIFMLQIPKITKKGVNAGEIKIPTYLRDLIPAFWGWPKEYSVKKDSIKKAKICTFKIIDTLNPNNSITDENVELFQREGENSFSILSEKLISLELNENDILRFIKTQSANGSYFTCEIIRTNANEYPIWEQFCTSLLKGSKRKYGMM